MQYVLNPTVTVITPSVGSSYLQYALNSVATQTYSNVRHLVVFDGVPKLNVSGPNIDICEFPYKTGADGYYGHRIYAAMSQLIDSDYICFLDEDNWYDNRHIELLMKTVMENPGVSFVHSLRSIHDKKGNLLCLDNCESLGRYPIYLNNNAFLVDTSSYMFSRDFIRQTGHIWNERWGADRRFFHTVKDHFKYECSGVHTLCYQLDGNPNSVNHQFFIDGNKVMEQRYGSIFPWEKKFD